MPLYKKAMLSGPQATPFSKGNFNRDPNSGTSNNSLSVYLYMNIVKTGENLEALQFKVHVLMLVLQ